MVYRAPVTHGIGRFDTDKNTVNKALRRASLCIFLGMM